ncbi:LysR family transcriptional regulator [Bradyrhizobium sp. Lot33]
MSVSFNTLDLNLLKVFDAVMEERSVLRASQKVGLSQSAVSHSLARLREILDDDLFVRTATGMQPTARALTMAPQVHEALRSLEAAVELPTFVPGELHQAVHAGRQRLHHDGAGISASEDTRP